MTGAPHGIVLGRVIFSTIANDLPDVVEGKVKFWTNDYKVNSKLSSDNERSELQEKLKFNAAKCKALQNLIHKDYLLPYVHLKLVFSF